MRGYRGFWFLSDRVEFCGIRSLQRDPREDLMADERPSPRDQGEVDGTRLTRRKLLYTGASGAAAAYGLSAATAGAARRPWAAGRALGSGTVTFGSNASDA